MTFTAVCFASSGSRLRPVKISQWARCGQRVIICPPLI